LRRVARVSTIDSVLKRVEPGTDREARPLALLLLGSPRLEAGGRVVDLETRKALALLAYLAVAREPVSRDTLVTLLWPEADHRHGRAVLRRTLFAVKRTPAGSRVQATRETVRLVSQHMSVDVADFERELGEATRHGHPPATRCETCLAHLMRAAALYRDDFLKGLHLRDSVTFDDWQFFESERLRGLLSRVLERLAWCHAAFGAYAEAVETAQRQLALDPLNEKAHGTLMLLHAWSGRPAAALRQYQECVRILREEIAAEPSDEISALNDAIREERAPAPPASAQAGRQSEGKAEPARERREAAVLCVRTRGAGTLLGAAAGSAIDRYGGRLIHSLPGDLLAVFGLERTLEGQSEIALRAALDLQAEAGSERLRAGVAAGEIELSGMRAAPVVEGSAVRQAARLAAAAEPGQVLASEAAARLARGAIAFVQLGVLAKGLEQPLRSFEAQGLLPEPRKTRGVEGVQAAMVGRTRQYAALRWCLEAALKGEGQVVCVTGEAGVGKSRLVEELRRSAAATARVTWLEGRCLDIGSTASYWPLLDMLRGPGLGTNGLAPTLARLAHAGIIARGRGLEIATCLERLASGRTRESADDPSAAKQRTFEAIRDLLFALARERPLVLVFEDLHWADSLSLDLILWLIDQISSLSLLLLCVYRPEREHRCSHLAAAAARKCPGRFAEVTLGDLDPRDSLLMVESLLSVSELPRGVSRPILALAQGNPLFLEEVTRSLIEAGSLSREGGLWRVQGEITEPPVPTSVRDVILGRFDRLDAQLKSLLQIASVLGPLFDPAVLGRLVGGGPWVDSALWQLEEREFVYEARTIPRREYSFKHVLTQQTIYEATAPSRRRSMHAEVARTLEELYEGRTNEVCEALAFHHEQAGGTERAIELYAAAGEKAKERHASAEAVSHLERAIRLLRATPQSPRRDESELRLRVAVGMPFVLVAGHQSDAVGRNYERALELCRSTRSEEPLFQVLMGLRRFVLARGDIRRSLELTQMLLSHARTRPERARAHMMQNEVLLHAGRLEESIAHADRAVAASRREDAAEQIRLFGNDSRVGADAISSVSRWAVGQADTAVERSQRAIERARALGSPFNLAMALYFASVVRRLRREPELVKSLADELLAICEERAFGMYQPMAAAMLAWSRAQGPAAEEARAAARVTVDQLRALNMGMFLFHLPELAEACARSGAIRQGLEAADEALGLAEKTGQSFWESELHRLRAEMLASSGDRDGALSAAQRAAGVAAAQGALAFQLRALSTLVRLAGRGPAAARYLEDLARAYARSTQGLDTPDLREARQLLG
jgi:DNA-binding SARP family transcriptional activator